MPPAGLFARVICSGSVPFQLRGIKVNIPQVAGAISCCLIIEMFGCRIAAFAAGCDRFCADGFAELDYGDKAVAAGAIPFFRISCRARPKEASEPQLPDVNPTGMLGAASLKGCTMSPVRR